MKIVLSKSSLQQHFNENNFVQETVLQLNKDLLLCGLEEIKINQITYPVLMDKLVSQLKILLEDSPEIFRNLLYRIDLKEESIVNEFTKSSNNSFTTIVAKKIIVRELTKVIIRKRYN